MSKKVVVKLQVHDEKEKRKALKEVSSLSGIESLAMDMKEKKLTVVGDVDPVQIVGKLRKSWHTEIVTVGPAKEPEKPKDNGEKEDDKKGGDKKESDQIAELLKLYKDHYPQYTEKYSVYSAEENPNSCVIC